jgi:hypothetical protein
MGENSKEVGLFSVIQAQLILDRPPPQPMAEG